MKTETKIWVAITLMFFIFAVGLVGQIAAQEMAYCRNAETGEVIVIEANMVCPMGFYRI